VESKDELDNFDLDLLDLVSSDLSTTNQYLVFEGSNKEIYAINISKVIEVLVCKKLEMVKNGNDDNIIRGTAKIRDEIATVISFDEWFGNDILHDDEYEFAILAGYGGHNIAIMVKNVEFIVNINFDNMKDNSFNNSKTSFIANIKLNSVDRLCTVFDCDKLLIDIFKSNYKEDISKNVLIKENFNSEKVVLFADDSRYIRKIVESLFTNMNIRFKMFENGKELFDYLTYSNPNDIGLIITDLEMPIMDGKSLVKSIHDVEVYNDINIIVHTNMSNFIIENSLMDLGVKEVIGKIDMEKLSISIRKYFKK